MRTKKTLEKIASVAALAATVQLAAADGLSGDVRYLNGGDFESDYLETNLFYDVPGVDTSCFTFLDANKGGNIFGKTTCTLKNSIGNSNLHLKAQVVHNSRSGGVFSEGGLGFNGSVPFPKSVPIFLDLTYFPLFKKQGFDVGEVQKLEWFAKYTGELPLNVSLSSFGEMTHKANEGASMGYGEVNLKVPIDGKDSPFFVGYSLALIPSGEMKPDFDNRLQVGVNFEF